MRRGCCSRARAAWSALAVLAACAPADEPPPFVEVADVRQLMQAVIEPAAEVYWDAVGTILDENGVTEIRPADDEAWEAVRNAAFVVAESGNLLMMEGRAVDDDAWLALSRAMIEVGRRAIAAAEAQDDSAVFEIGGELYGTCTTCHAAYALETLRPSDERSR